MRKDNSQSMQGDLNLLRAELSTLKTAYKISRRIERDMIKDDQKRVLARLSQRRMLLQNLQKLLTMIDGVGESKHLGRNDEINILLAEWKLWLEKIDRVNQKIIQKARNRQDEISEDYNNFLNSKKAVGSYNKNVGVYINHKRNLQLRSVL